MHATNMEIDKYKEIEFTFSIDRGGTFCDFYCEVFNKNLKTRKEIVTKLLSENKNSYPDAPTEGIRRIMEKELGTTFKSSLQIPTHLIKSIRMGTTVATNALLERKGRATALITTKGFKDLLRIGTQARPDIFDIFVKKPELLYQEVVEVEERVLLKGEKDIEMDDMGRKVTGISGEEVIVNVELNEKQLEKNLQRIFDEGKIKSIAVVLMHSYTFIEHEKKVEMIAKRIGFTNISVSHKIIPMVKIVDRGFTTLVDAYLSPILQDYIDTFCKGFKDNLKGVDVLFMQSDGGLTSASTFFGSKSIFSGPAGGVLGYSQTTIRKPNDNSNLIGFDMGGTSTDVSRYDSNGLHHVYDNTIADVKIQVPQLDIKTVAAGGGSRLFFKQGRFIVGPESSGSFPGPICYGKNGYLSITDANLILGRLIPDFFPKIFGKNEDQPLNVEETKKEFEKLTKTINEHRKKTLGSKKDLTIYQVAQGFIDVANETMCRPIRNITVSKGYDIRKHTLCSFGGASQQHCCSIARILGIDSIRIHKFAGILSAVGLSLADTVEDFSVSCNLVYEEKNFEFFNNCFKELEAKGRKILGEKYDNLEVVKFLNLRYDKTNYSIMTKLNPGTKEEKEKDYKTVFENQYNQEHGFIIPNRNIIICDVRVRVIGKTKTYRDMIIKREKEKKKSNIKVKKVCDHQLYVDGNFKQVGVYDLETLPPGARIKGPAVILQNTSTIFLENYCALIVDDDGDMEISLEKKQKDQRIEETEEVDPILLSIFSNRFMSIAEEIGYTLQRLAISTNIKERLDFSCAIFDSQGRLISNAPHIPVHLGSLSACVKHQIQILGDSWTEGTVICTNHPLCSGTHLPDITIINPVYLPNQKDACFYLASRGHHADIGSISSGSMPPNSKLLEQEGVQIKSFKIVKDGKFQIDELKERFKESRCLKDNIADLKAQIASTNRGIQLLKGLIKEFSLKTVQRYMTFIMENAERAVREMLKKFCKTQNSKTVYAEDFMDDGSCIRLKVTLDEENENAIFDFTGTTSQVYGNTNAPRSITSSAVIYCLRCMVNEDIPLNHGCLKPIKIIIPEGSLLSPSAEAAVVGGNVETSQRITDVIFKAFHFASASQGTMNNFIFGNSSFGYYETIAGGIGAGKNYDGEDATHSHMTNTRITDPEILERRYPVILRAFEIRKDSGGNGKWKGGNGVTRKFEFLTNLEVGILSQRRVFAPYGLNGGENGKVGKNSFQKYPEMKEFNLGGSNSVKVKKHDIVEIQTPGGGGYGKP